MPILVACSHCGQQFRVRDEFAGRRGKCPRCQQLLQVPEAAGVAEDAVSIEPSAPISEPTPSQPIESVTEGVPVVAAEIPQPGIAPLPAANTNSRVTSELPSGEAAVAAPPLSSSTRLTEFRDREQRRLRVPVWVWFLAGALLGIAAVAAALLRAWLMRGTEVG